jgi:hypothetical protein
MISLALIYVRTNLSFVLEPINIIYISSSGLWHCEVWLMGANFSERTTPNFRVLCPMSLWHNKEKHIKNHHLENPVFLLVYLEISYRLSLWALVETCRLWCMGLRFLPGRMEWYLKVNVASLFVAAVTSLLLPALSAQKPDRREAEG